MRVCLVSLSPVAGDERVRRHGDLLASLGVDVIGAGFRASAGSSSWPVIEVDDPPWTTAEKALLVPRLLPARVGPPAADRAYWRLPRHRAVYDAARGTSADLFVANDWNALPIAAALADDVGSRFAYDSHEYAVEERADRFKWRLLWPPLIRAIEGRHIRDAAYVTTVSAGIAAQLEQDYSLSSRPLVVRNAPAYQSLPVAPVHDPVTVLFHGSLQQDRGLELLIDSVPLWSPGRRLVVRGSGAPGYVDALAARAQRLGVATRVEFEPPVVAADVVRAAHETADVGIHPMPAVSRQTRFALPNKFFEYVMAGLSVVVMAGTEMAELVSRYGIGALISGPSPQAVAHAVNSLDLATIRRHKAQSTMAAADLSWDHESRVLVGLYEELQGAHGHI